MPDIEEKFGKGKPISEVTFLAVPHFGAQGGSAILNHFTTGLLRSTEVNLPDGKLDWVRYRLKYVLKLVLSSVKIIIFPAYFLVNNTARGLVAMNEDAQAALR